MSTSSRVPLASAIALWILAVVALLFFLRAASQLLIPIVLGILISYVLEPIVAWLTRFRVPRIAAASGVMLVLLGLAGLGVYSLADDAVQAFDALPQAMRRAREMVAARSSTGPAAKVREAAGALQGTASGQGQQQESNQPRGTSGQAASTGEGQAPQSQQSAQSQSQSQSLGSRGSLGSALGNLVQRGIGSLFALAGHLMVIVFLVFFLLLSGHHFRARFVEIAGPDAERRKRMATIIADVNSQIERFLLVRLVTAVIVAVLTWIVLAWMGVQHAAVWGIMAGVFNSIPYFGPVIVSGGLLVVGLVQGGGMAQALQMSGAALFITSIEGWLITPPLMGKAERMSAIAVFLGLLLWTWIWGAWGTILAVPMLVILKAVADHTPSMKPVGRLLAP
jgi:predicted PurR-regulated permease PerM